VLGALSLILTFKIAEENFSVRVANLAVLATACNPFFIFNSASYFSHASCLFFVLIGVYGALRSARDPQSRVPALLMGLGTGVAFSIRSYTALVLSLPFLAYILIRAARERRFSTGTLQVLIASGPFLGCLSALLAYNYLQTGDPFVQPFSKYSDERPFHFFGDFGLAKAWSFNIFDRFRLLAEWIPLAPFFLAAYWISAEHRKNSLGWLLQSSFFSLVVGYFFLFLEQGNQYGPRYWYEASFAVFILIGCVLARCGPAGVLLLVLFIGLNVDRYARTSNFMAGLMKNRMNVFDLVQEQKITDAIVVLKTGTEGMPPADLTRNGIRFDAPVLYVRDLGARNQELFDRYEGRMIYYYTYNPGSRQGTLTPDIRNRRKN